MYLKNIKLAGFKSFVDPTTIPIRGYLNAIVGPNGCGKSNVVDAVRWVIGEMSAKQLRGQTMSDVIFNGTNVRKPVGKASVELQFENNAGKLTGEYASYSEIAIRREVGREGQSSYFINGTSVRRRDVVDIFLGTGLGPRSYAIIEQGMISNLIEAKPEDLRVYIEEAAGISKYKERRRETENRIRHTNENLDRINDIREELEKQLRHLKRQANAAERYKVYKQEERLLEAQIRALEWQQLEQKLSAQDRLINDQDVLREEQTAKQRHIETEIEKARIQHEEVLEKQGEIQKNYYGFGAEIARLEQRINDTQEQTKRWEKELQENKTLSEELSENTFECQNQIKELLAELERLNPRTTDVRLIADQAREALAKAEKNMDQWQAEWDKFQASSSQLDGQIGVSRTKIEHNQLQLKDISHQKNQIQANIAELKLDELQTQIEPLRARCDQVDSKLHEAKTKLQTCTHQITEQRALNHEYSAGLQKTRQELQKLEARHASLDALQKSALGQDKEQANVWLNDRNLCSHPRLGQNLHVAAGWELAVETVLGGYFDAVCVDEIDRYLPQLNELTEGQLTLLERPKQSQQNTTTNKATLADKIDSAWPFRQWLTGIYVAENIAEGERLRTELAMHESVITQDGVWLGVNWVRVRKETDTQSGILMREQQLKQLAQQITASQEKLTEQEQQLAAGEANLDQLETERDINHQLYQDLSAQTTQVQKELSSKKTHFDNEKQRQQQLQNSLTECEQRIASIQNNLQSAQTQLQELSTDQQRYATRRTHLITQRDQLRDVLEKQRLETQQKEQTANELEIRLSANENQLTVLRQTVQRDERQLKQLIERQEILTTNLSDSDAPLNSMNEELQTLLGKRLEVEKELHAVEEQVERHSQLLRNLEEQRNTLQRELNNFQEKIQELQMERQAIKVRQTTIKERLSETDSILEDVIAKLPEEAEIHEWEERLTAVTQRIQKLGSINLAAIEEYDATNERKEYLDRQQADLVEALTILQDAIRKIDRETRTKFRETFDRINQKFQEIFPIIFGGGQAHLHLTDEDLLSTGIVVKAQPPGKRNVNIHMLSGGEKALTAISLVFALFQLNPAPFCILDEVDAPLDDVNVGRFCQLVKEMSQQTQFLIISHNKVTIEMADHLMGVTMQEPGVSRIVSVDMEQAIGMVEAA